MIKKYIKDSITLLSVAASAITLKDYYQRRFVESSMMDKIKILEENKSNLSDKVSKLELDQVQDKLTIAKLDSYSKDLQKHCNNAKTESEAIINIEKDNVNGASETTEHLQNIIHESKKSNDVLDKIIDLIKDSTDKKNFFGETDWFKVLTDFFKNWSEMLASLNLEQLGALAHLVSAITILLCLFSIIGIVYSEFLFKYLKLEEKYPRIGKYLKIRKLFQHYYLFINFLFIILILSAIIFINCKILLL